MSTAQTSAERRCDQHLRSQVWQVSELGLWSVRKSQTLYTLARKADANEHCPEINFVWNSHALTPNDQRKIEEGYHNGERLIYGIQYKDNPYYADLTDPSAMCILSALPPTQVFPKKLRRVDRFMSGVRSMITSEDGWIQGWLDRPYEQEWPVKSAIKGPISIHSRIPNRFDHDFEYPPIPFRERVGYLEFKTGDQVSYHITRIENDSFIATDLKLEYKSEDWGIDTLDSKIWGHSSIPPFVPERLKTEVWECRAMNEVDRKRHHALTVAMHASIEECKMIMEDRFFWKPVHPKMMDCLRWLFNNPSQSTRFPWLTRMDASKREQFVDFENMMQYTRSNTNAFRLNISRIRRVTRFKSEVKKTSRVRGLRVAWLSRSVEQTMLYDHGYDLIPLLVDSDDCGAEVRSALECGVWLEYSIRYIRMDPPIYGRHFYAERPRVMAESAIRQARQAWAQRLRAMGEESLLRQIRCEKRKSFQKMRAELDQRCPLVPMDRPRNATQMIGDLEVLIDQYDWLMNAQGFGFERKKLGDWTREDVIDWITCVDHGRFSAQSRKIRKRMEVYKLIGTDLPWLLSPYFNGFCLGLNKNDDAEILTELTKDLLVSHLRPSSL